MIGSALLVLLSAAPSSDERLFAIVRDQFERAGRSTPAADPSLTRAAKQIAERALSSGVDDAASALRVTAAVSRTGGWDASPVAIVIRGEPDELPATLAHNALAEEPVSLIGLAQVERDGRGAAAVLLARRKVDLEAFPRSLPAASGAEHRLCGVLRDPLTSAEVYVTRPAGDVDRLALTASKGRLCASVTFPTLGRHTVEVMAKGPRGPEVAALFFVEVGTAGQVDDVMATAEPTSDREARAQVLVRINSLRLRMGLTAVIPDPALDAIAQAWAQRLATENFFAHVGPDGSDPKSRLTQAKYRFVSAGENLGLSSGPLAAHFGIEHSPGHRKNLLEKDHRALGVGLARRADGMTVLVEVLALPSAAAQAEPVADPVAAAYGAIAAERARRHLPKLSPSPLLEALAQQHARDAFDAQLPKAQLPGRARLHDQVFENVETVKTVSVDLFVADAPTQIVESKNLGSPQNSMMGVGLVLGDSAQYGKARYWIVVIYAGRTDAAAP
jgi:uncharacterized protein YkwD